MQYPVVYFVQYLIGLLMLYLLIDLAHFNKLIAPVLTVVVTIPCTFVLSRFVITGRLAMTPKQRAFDGKPLR